MEATAGNSSGNGAPPKPGGAPGDAGALVDRERWDLTGRSRAYAELDHPADIFIEVYGRDLPQLFENGLFAFYDQIAAIDGFDTAVKRTISAKEATPADTFRALLSEALYKFESERFVAAVATVQVNTLSGGQVEAIAHLGGEIADRERHVLCAEVKAITYHQLTVEQMPDGGWQATVLFDV